MATFVWTIYYDVLSNTGGTPLFKYYSGAPIVTDVLSGGVSVMNDVYAAFNDSSYDGTIRNNFSYIFPSTGVQSLNLVVDQDELMAYYNAARPGYIDDRYSIFAGTHSIVNIEIPSGVTELPPLCFWGCWRLSGITLSPDMTIIPEDMLRETNFACFVIPDHIVSATTPSFAFSAASEYRPWVNTFEYLTIGSSVTYIHFTSYGYNYLDTIYSKPSTSPTVDWGNGTYYNGIYLYHPENGTNYDYNTWHIPDQEPNAYVAYKPLSAFPEDTCSRMPEPIDPPIPTGHTAESGGTVITENYSGCPLVFDYSASTGVWNTLPIVATGGTTDNWWITYTIPANDTTIPRTITYYYLQYTGSNCDELVDTISYTISQAAGEEPTPPTPGAPYISLSGYSNNYLAGTGSCVSLPIIATNCTYSSFTATIDYNPNLTAHSVASVTEENGSLKLCLTSNPLTGDAQVAIITVILYDTNGNSYLHYLGLNQYGNPNPEPPTPSSNIWLTTTEQTISAKTSIPNNNYIWVGVKTSGCNMDSGAQTDITYTVSGANIVSGISQLSYVQTDTYHFQLYWNTNTSTSQREAYVTFTFKDTSGNTYNDTLHLMQLGGKRITINPNWFSFQSGSSSVTAVFSAVNTTIQSISLFSSGVSVGTFDVYPTVTINGTNIFVDMPENPAGGAYRSITYYYTVYDADNQQYTLTLNLAQAPGETPVTSWVYCNPTATTVTYTEGYNYIYVYYSGCSIPIDSSTSALSVTAFTYTISGDSFITDITPYKQSTSDVNQNRNRLRFYYSENTVVTQREAYINFTFYDTDGNSYNASCNISQAAYLYLDISPTAITVNSGVTSAYTTVGGANETLASFTYEILDTSTPGTSVFLSGVTVERSGNNLNMYFSPNPSTLPRTARIRFLLTSNSGNTYTRSFNLNQRTASGDPFITSSFGSEEVVGSGSTTLTGTVYPVLCEYDHITYMTGGTIPGMVVTTNGTQMFISVPANNTNQSRVGYVYITYYDTDGYTYQQTITIRQATGSGPGPGPDPDTGFVYTSFTISDNEQHRFFPEAQPGVTYYAAGQYYKTISACEARYSLYYVNSYGGVDVLPFKEKSWKKSDTITRFNYSRSFRNNTLEFENVNYMNEIKASWELHSGWLSDEQSQRMHELVESTIVYLYDAIEKEYTPVVMTDKKLEYKTYHNQGKKFYNYTITVEESQSKERR